MSKKLEFSDLDRRILERLSVDARVSNREIARELGMTEGSIRARLKRMADEKAIHVAAVTNYNYFERPLVVYLWIDVEKNYPYDDVIKALVDQPEISFVASLVGRADIMAITWVREANHFAEYLHEQIDRIPGIAKVEYEMSHDLVKHDHRIMTILP